MRKNPEKSRKVCHCELFEEHLLFCRKQFRFLLLPGMGHDGSTACRPCPGIIGFSQAPCPGHVRHHPSFPGTVSWPCLGRFRVFQAPCPGRVRHDPSFPGTVSWPSQGRRHTKAGSCACLVGHIKVYINMCVMSSSSHQN